MSQKSVQQVVFAVGWAVPTESRHYARNGGHGPPYKACTTDLRPWLQTVALRAQSVRLSGVLLAVTALSSLAAGTQPFRLISYSQEHGELQLDRSFTGKPIKVGAATYSHGLGTHAPSRAEVAIGSECRTFSANVGVDAHARQGGSVVFVVKVDGRVRFRSDLLRRGMAPVAVTADLSRAKRLELIVDSVGLPAGDHADWADAQVLMRGGKALRLSTVFRTQGLPKKRPAEASSRRGAKKCDVTECGATGDDDTDDSPAFQMALSQIASMGKGVLYIPAGDYRISKRVSAEVTGAGITIMGDGQGVSNIYCDSPDGMLKLHDEWCKSQITIKDLSFFATREGAGTAIEVSSPPRGARNFRTLTVQNVEMRGVGLPSRKYFSYGIKAIAQWRPLFMNVIFSGISDPSLKGDQSDRSAACGIQADWCYAPSFQHCYVWSAHTGYRVVCEGRPEGPEDCAFYRSFAVGCRVGIDVSTPIPEPQLVIDACHINCRDVGIRLKNRKFFHLRDNLLYGIDGADAHPYTDILITGRSFAGVISGNIFHSPARHNYKPTPAVRRTMVQIGAKCRNLSVTNNIFNAKGTALVVDDGATAIVTANNQYMNRQTKAPDEER